MPRQATEWDRIEADYRASLLPTREVASRHGVGRVEIANTRAIAAAVARMEVDTALIEGPYREPDAVALAWRGEELTIVCAPSPALLGGDPGTRLNVSTLRQADWLLRGPGSGTREAAEQALQPHPHPMHKGLRATAARRRSSASPSGDGTSTTGASSSRAASRLSSTSASRVEAAEVSSRRNMTRTRK